MALEWLKTHELNAFEAIETVRDYEKLNMGDWFTEINPEAIVNMLAYIYGEEILSEIDAENVEDLEVELKEIIE